MLCLYLQQQRHEASLDAPGILSRHKRLLNAHNANKIKKKMLINNTQRHLSCYEFTRNLILSYLYLFHLILTPLKPEICTFRKPFPTQYLEDATIEKKNNPGLL